MKMTIQSKMTDCVLVCVVFRKTYQYIQNHDINHINTYIDSQLIQIIRLCMLDTGLTRLN